MMSREDLKNWALSEYNEGTEDQLDYYINERSCSIGDKAYLYSHEDDTLTEMEIICIFCASVLGKIYENFPEDVLLKGEDKYNADTSAEFITDNDCYLVWFKYVTQPSEHERKENNSMASVCGLRELENDETCKKQCEYYKKNGVCSEEYDIKFCPYQMNGESPTDIPKTTNQTLF